MRQQEAEPELVEAPVHFRIPKRDRRTWERVLAPSAAAAAAGGTFVAVAVAAAAVGGVLGRTDCFVDSIRPMLLPFLDTPQAVVVVVAAAAAVEHQRGQ